jgi:transketolase
MDILGKLVMVTIFILPTISLLPIYGQNIVNNTAHTIENAAEENRKIDLNNIYKETNQMERKDSTELLNQVREAAKKIVIGSADVLSNISGEIKKGLE